ncbi:LysR substrate-binding domain-containing protein [Cucumibacter marinus]|uniref:LysR substrate-binding domain-containing protein n=1 Tax=Cucumibacter marinus TaxID=1121252 RepID=UPI00041F9535|nr:LysR substrate-binding domain-containing protein [Cucumibacter marinus]
MKLSHLNALRAFEAVMRTGSFKAAADEIGVTPAAVGQQIRGLEDFLSRKLFRRTAGGAEPTEEALRVKAGLTAGFAAITEALTELRDENSGLRIAVTLPESFAENWFTRRVAGFYSDNPRADLRLEAANRRVDIAAEGFDFAIRYSAPPADGLSAIDLFGDAVLPLCTPGFAQRHGLSPSTRSVLGVPLVRLENRTPDPQWADWDTWCPHFGMAYALPETGMRYSRISSGLQAALAGQGLVLCGITEAFDSIDRGLLLAPFGYEKNLPTAYRYRLVSTAGRPLSPLQSRFRDWLAAEAESFDDAVLALIAT